MSTIALKKKTKKAKGFNKLQDGFTLVEILIAMVILIMIVFAFTPLLVGSIERIHYAGDKSEALYEGQSVVEVNIAERVAEVGNDLVFSFENSDGTGSTTITVQGRYIDVEESVREASAWLSGFIPSIPWMQIEPSRVVEGYKGSSDADPTEIVITIQGRESGDELLTSDIDGIYIYDQNNFYITKILPDDITGSESGADFSFQLPAGLRTNDTPHLISLSWIEDSDGIEVIFTISARLYVDLPEALAVSSGQDLLASSDIIETWKYRSKMTGSGELRSVAWTGFEYVFIGSSTGGKIGIWREREAPRFVSGTSELGNLNSVAYGGVGLVAAGDNGLVVTSTNATDWNSDVTIDSGGSDFKSVTWDVFANEFAIVGNNGAFHTSADGITWNKVVIIAPTSVNLRGVAYKSTGWIAVGEHSGYAIYCNNVDNVWTYIEIGGDKIDKALNDVIYAYDNTNDSYLLIAVGDGGTILTSPDGGATWEKWTFDPAVSTNLNAVDWGYIATESEVDGEIIVDATVHYIIVGDSGTVITGTGTTITDWSKLSGHSITSHIKGVAPKWVKQ